MEPYHFVVAGAVSVTKRFGRSGLTASSTSFPAPSPFRLLRASTQFTSGGRVFRSAGEADVIVRYSPRVGRWIEEKWPCKRCDDGSVQVTHGVADARWIVRHVLQYWRDAEIVEPAEFREMVASSLERIGGETRGS